MILTDEDLSGQYLIIDRIGPRYSVYQTTDRIWCTPETLRAFCVSVIAEIDSKW